MKDLTHTAWGRSEERAGALTGNEKVFNGSRKNAAEDRVRQAVETGLWQDVEYVPKIADNAKDGEYKTLIELKVAGTCDRVVRNSAHAYDQSTIQRR